MRSPALASRLRRQLRLLALTPVILAGASCIAGEPIEPATKGSIEGRYLMTMSSSGVESDSLPAFVRVTAEEGLPVYLRYASLDLYEDGTYVEVFELEIRDGTGSIVLGSTYDTGSGTWTMVGEEVRFTAVVQPLFLQAPPPAIQPPTTWKGYRGTGGLYAFSMERMTIFSLFLHYRRY